MPWVVHVVLEDLDEVGSAEFEEGAELLDHPAECYIGDLLVFVATADVGVHAGEPDLLQVCFGADRFLP